jgi:sugar lactone lactonase YvrE
VTLTLGPHQVTEAESAEALIREARRLQRRRWRRGAALVTLAVVVAAVVVTSLQGGGPARPRPASHHPPGPPAQRRVNGPSLGLATSYQLTGPNGVAVDRAGDIYFTDGSRVLEVDRATRQLVVVAGTGAVGFSGDGGPGPLATLSGPSGVAVAPNGDVYFQDNNRVRKVSAADGVISTVAGDGRTGRTGPTGADGRTGSTGDGGPALRAPLYFGNPGNGIGGLSDTIAVGPDGDLYLAETGNNEVQKVSLATGVITRAAGPGIHCGPLDGVCLTAPHPCAPVGVAVDSASNVFVATACGSIRERVAATGVTSTIFSTYQNPALAGTGGEHAPTGLAVGNDKTLFVTEAYGRRLLELDLASGRVVLVAGTGVETFPQPGQTAGDGGPASNASFGGPLGAAADGHGNVYVADFFNNAIRMIDGRTGVISTVAGQIPQSPEQQGHCC